MILQRIAQFQPYELFILYAFFFLYPVTSLVLACKKRDEIHLVKGIFSFLLVCGSLIGYLTVMKKYSDFSKELIVENVLYSKNLKSTDREYLIKIKEVSLKDVQFINQAGQEKTLSKDLLFLKYSKIKQN